MGVPHEQPRPTRQRSRTARYTWGGDEFLFVEIAEGMSLEANFMSNSIANALEGRSLPGIVDICPANASLLIRFNPDELAPPNWRASCAASRSR